jgi:hypothetical protein
LVAGWFVGLRQLTCGADEGSVATPSRLSFLRTLVSLATLALATGLAIALLFADAPAQAFVTTVGSAKIGLQPRSTLILENPIKEHALEPEGFDNSNGNPIVSANKTYAIYWEPTKNYYHGDWQNVIDTFFQKMGATSGSLASVFAVDDQYTDEANQHALYNSTFQGAYTDTNEYPASGCKDPNPLETKDLIGPVVAGKHTPICVTDKQVKEQLELFISQHSLQKGMSTIFYLLTPPGVTVCLDAGGASGHCSDYTGTTSEESYENSFCSYHSDISPSSPLTGDGNSILYGVIPWTAGGLGDFHLTPNDEKTPAFDCQDGGWDPSSKPPEKHESAKVKGAKELKEIAEESPEEQAKAKEAEELEGPHQQEPNQVKCPSPDGGCDTGLADLIINQIAIEQQNIVTNPLLDGWQDPDGNEATDECRSFFAPVLGGGVTAQEGSVAGTLYNQDFAEGKYYLNDAFNLAAYKLPYPGVPCLTGVSLVPQFTAPNPVNANEIVGFNGMESDITLNAGLGFSAIGEPRPAYATYTWNFGDGSPPVVGFAPGAPTANSPAVSPCGAVQWEPPCAASVYHSYQYGGTYNVTLTVTDVGENTARVTEPVTVIGPSPPSPTPTPAPANTTPGGSGGSGSSSGSSGGTATTPNTVPTTPPPVLGAAVTSTSLKKVLSGGLSIRYTTNEQVAGSIEVLLEGATAKRLGVKGATATGLPQGTPRSIVIGTAVLVTTKAGQGTIRIKFSARVAARLKHTHKLKLMLRLFARNASRQSPQTTTVLSTVVLNP